MVLASLSAGFQSLPLLPTSTVGPSGADSRVRGFVYVLGPCGSLQWTFLWGWEFLPLPPQPSQVFSISSLRLCFPALEPWGCLVCFTPPLFLQIYLSTNVGHWGPPATVLPDPVLQPAPCHESSLPSCLSPPLLPVWMNMSSLTPWLSDFHTVRFSISSGCFFVFKLLLSFFWLCEKA